MSAYIYLFQERIIYWAPQTPYYKPVALNHIKWYSVSGAIPMPLNDMVARGNVGYNLQKGFYTVEGDPPADWDERHGYIKRIQILSSFNSISNTQKARYTDNSIGQSLADVLLLDEIRRYRETNSLDGLVLLETMLETVENGLTPEALVTKLWLQYESYRTILAYLNRLEFNIRKLLSNKDFDKASELVTLELEKMRV